MQSGDVEELGARDASFHAATARATPVASDRMRALATLEDDDLERLTGWFTAGVNRWGLMPRAASLAVRPDAQKR